MGVRSVNRNSRGFKGKRTLIPATESFAWNCPVRLSDITTLIQLRHAEPTHELSKIARTVTRSYPRHLKPDVEQNRDTGTDLQSLAYHAEHLHLRGQTPTH